MNQDTILRTQATYDAIMNPKVGDIFQEMLCTPFIVVDITNDIITTTFDHPNGQIERFTKEAFIDYFSYNPLHNSFWVDFNKNIDVTGWLAGINLDDYPIKTVYEEDAIETVESQIDKFSERYFQSQRSISSCHGALTDFYNWLKNSGKLA